MWLAAWLTLVLVMFSGVGDTLFDGNVDKYFPGDENNGALRGNNMTSFRKFGRDNETHVCTMFIYTDPFLWRQVYKLEGHNTTATYQRIKKLLYKSVGAANRVFSMAEFYGRGHTIHKGISFYLKDYFIDTDRHCAPKRRPSEWNVQETDCEEPDVPMADLCSVKPRCRYKGKNKYGIFCNDMRSMRFFLHAFSARKHDQHCLAYAFTYRDMSDFQGIAWIKGHNPNDSNTTTYYGYCSIDDSNNCRPDNGGGRSSWPPYYYRNTGAVNLHLVRGVLSEPSAINVFVHELGHSLGARHDDQPAECNPSGANEFLMTGDAKKIVLGQTNGDLSECSSRQIGLNLDQVTCWSERRGYQEQEVCQECTTAKDARVNDDGHNDWILSALFTGMAGIMMLLTVIVCTAFLHRRIKKKRYDQKLMGLLCPKRKRRRRSRTLHHSSRPKFYMDNSSTSLSSHENNVQCVLVATKKYTTCEFDKFERNGWVVSSTHDLNEYESIDTV